MDNLVLLDQANRIDLLRTVARMLTEHSGMPAEEAATSDDPRARFARGFVIGWLREQQLHTDADQQRSN